MKILRPALHILAIAVALYGGALIEAAHEHTQAPQKALSLLTVENCKNVLGVIVVTGDGTLHNFPGVDAEAIAKVQALVPPNAFTRVIVCPSDQST